MTESFWFCWEFGVRRSEGVRNWWDGYGGNFFGVMVVKVGPNGWVNRQEDRIVAPGVSLGNQSFSAAAQDVGDIAVFVFAKLTFAVGSIAHESPEVWRR